MTKMSGSMSHGRLHACATNNHARRTTTPPAEKKQRSYFSGNPQLSDASREAGERVGDAGAAVRSRSVPVDDQITTNYTRALGKRLSRSRSFLCGQWMIDWWYYGRQHRWSGETTSNPSLPQTRGAFGSPVKVRGVQGREKEEITACAENTASGAHLFDSWPKLRRAKYT